MDDLQAEFDELKAETRALQTEIKEIKGYLCRLIWAFDSQKRALKASKIEESAA